MADEQYGWLDRDAAERLLRGEPLRTVDDEARAQAGRLSEALDALARPSAGTDGELPGETAALAAFRAARAAGGTEAESGPAGPFKGADAGLVRLGRPVPEARRRWPVRPLRLGLAAGLAAVTIGGVAAAAGAGVLPTPFGGDEPEPGTSVTAAATPRPSGTAPADGTGSASPDGSAEETEDGSSHDTAGDGSARPGTGDDGAAVRGSREWWNEVLDSCRDVRDGKSVGAARWRALEDAAGGHGSGRVTSYCRTALASHGGNGSAAASGGGGGQSGGKGNGNAKNNGNGNPNSGGKGNGNQGQGNGNQGQANGNQGNGNQGQGNGNGGDEGNDDEGGGGGGHGRGHGNGGDEGHGHHGGGHGPKRP
jgi:hypothetical protein